MTTGGPTKRDLKLLSRVIHLAPRFLRVTITLLSVFHVASVCAAHNGNDVLHHDIKLVLKPLQHRLELTDRITLPTPVGNNATIDFLLHEALVIDSPDDAIERLTPAGGKLGEIPKHAGVPLVMYRVRLQNANHPLTLKYHGEIHHPPGERGGETPGLITEQGVFLARSSGWYPVFGEKELLTFSMNVTVPAGWAAVSQGTLKHDIKSQHRQMTWSETHPQDDIYLVASQFHEYRDKSDGVDAMVFLRDKDDDLAQKYMQATTRYIGMYNRLIGPYPYSKFALVENFWQTGYGMPSFTLLGSRVIRLPFIVYTSYPHEILHNYWGNGVYVDYDTGNWAEGLTAYLADHLLKEQRGQGAEYRRSVLQKYTDFVSDGRDFPLTEFRSRHDSATEAVGYGKTLMLFHMLRTQLGNDVFLKAIRSFYRQYRFHIASFADIQQAFNSTINDGLDDFFEQWVRRTGSPRLALGNVRRQSVSETGKENEYRIKLTLKQLQPDDAYRLEVPVFVYLQGQQTAYRHDVSMINKEQHYSIIVPGKPVALDVDPRFDVFRRLDSREIPAALSQGFGAEKPLLVLPADANPDLAEEFKNLAKQWQQRQLPSMEIVNDQSLEQLPRDRSVWLLGWNNRFRDKLNDALRQHKVTVSNESFTVKDNVYTKDKFAALFTARHPDNENKTLLWLAAKNPAAVPGLERKLPHYGKYSYLVFEGDAPDNVAKGQWTVTDSPMRHVFDKALFDFSTSSRPHQPLVMPSH